MTKINPWVRTPIIKYGFHYPTEYCLNQGLSTKTYKANYHFNPTSIEKLRDREMIVREFVALDELERFLSKGSREDIWPEELIQHIFKAISTDSFKNAATCNAITEKKYNIGRNRRVAGIQPDA
jgi:hypothetical protein